MKICGKEVEPSIFFIHRSGSTGYKCMIINTVNGEKFHFRSIKDMNNWLGYKFSCNQDFRQLIHKKGDNKKIYRIAFL